MALTVAGVFSTVAFAVVAAAGALITENPAAAGVSLVVGFLLAAAVAVIVVAMRFPRARVWLVGRTIAALRLSKRVTKRPRGEPRSVVTGALERVGALHLGYRIAAGAFGWALVNRIADAACLVCAIKAVGETVPWTAVLIIWTAGVGAASLSPVPAGLGIVDIVLIAALATAGLHGKYAVAAVLIHRFISLKVLITVAWLIYHYVAGRRRGYAPESAPSSPQSTAPLHNENASITLSLMFFEFNATGRTPFDDMSTPQKCPLTRHYLQTTSGNRPIWGVPFRCAPDTARMRMYQGVRHRRNG